MKQRVLVLSIYAVEAVAFVVLARLAWLNDSDVTATFAAMVLAVVIATSVKLWQWPTQPGRMANPWLAAPSLAALHGLPEEPPAMSAVAGSSGPPRGRLRKPMQAAGLGMEARHAAAVAGGATAGGALGGLVYYLSRQRGQQPTV